MTIPLPPKGEQESIVAYLDKETADIDTAIDRARLIADVVTGKLDVREAAMCLPDEVRGKERDGHATPGQNGFSRLMETV